MWWLRDLTGAERMEQALSRLRLRALPSAPVAPIVQRSEQIDADDLRLFPIVGRDLCFPVSALLARGKLEEAGRLVSDRAWVASTPLYG
jgi:hypothetical protein